MTKLRTVRLPPETAPDTPYDIEPGWKLEAVLRRARVGLDDGVTLVLVEDEQDRQGVDVPFGTDGKPEVV